MARPAPAPPRPAAKAARAISGAAIAAAAARYAGRGYVYGGSASTPGDWDCSSFVSWVLGHDLGLPLPGGRWGQPGFPPSAHGPVVTSYAGWTATTAVSEAQAAAGDLVCWPGAGTAGHIGIVLAPGKMVSALNPQLGTLVSPITGYGPLGVPQVYRRLTGITPGGVLAAAQPGGGGNTTAALLLGAAVVAAMLGTVLALTALAALGATAGAGWLAARAAR